MFNNLEFDYSTGQYWIHDSLFITLYLKLIEMDCVISEVSNKGTILQRSYRKITILWSFSYNSFLKFQYMEIIWEPHHDCVISKISDITGLYYTPGTKYIGGI